ncbi:MAG: replication and repair protein RecF [Candidatus Levybacteria bacterium]|nr:replication and repair protein RecF [Candidatus Levybacteria bacterium]
MIIEHLDLQNFRSYPKNDFNFSPSTTLIVGPNTAGKSNLIEAIFFLASGRSFRTDKDDQLVKFEKGIARIKGKVARLPAPEGEANGGQEDKVLEAMIVKGGEEGQLRSFKKYLVNGVVKRKADFVGNFFAVLFAPNDLEIIIGSPSRRRDFLDNILIQTDREYRLAIGFYEKGLRIRNALLHKAKETGRRSEKEFIYWDNLLVVQGQKITKKREAFIEYLNNSKKHILDFKIFYDKSIISKERLLQYQDAEVASGVTLVGPHRDDFYIRINPNKINANEYEYDVKNFGSRGQQRLAVLQLKILELNYIEQTTQNKPTLLLDDIFSELDEGHINLVLDQTLLRPDFAKATTGKQGYGGQAIMTTTHEEFIPKKLLKGINVIELGK